jgi:enoyl-CoA hydratase/carnithine racemase
VTSADEESTLVERRGHVATITINRPPNNFLDIKTLASIVEHIEQLGNEGCRAIVLASQGKHFCAGADLTAPVREPSDEVFPDLVRRLHYQPIPLVAAIQGGAVGAGLGLALCADFRVVSAGAFLTARFARIGFSHGWGLTLTLPRAAGSQMAAQMLFTGRRVSAEEAVGCGLADTLSDSEHRVDEALRLAEEIAASAPLAVRSIRRTLRADIHEHMADVMTHELEEQKALTRSKDFKEGITASKERRDPQFTGE